MCILFFPIKTSAWQWQDDKGLEALHCLQDSHSTMFPTQENTTELNVSSGDCFILMAIGRNTEKPISSVILLMNFVVGFPMNLWVVWLISTGTMKTLSSDLVHLNLAVAEMTFCLVLPAQLFCMYASEDMQRRAMWVIQPHEPFVSVLMHLLVGMVWMVRPLFQCCICLERYVAVVRPQLYLR